MPPAQLQLPWSGPLRYAVGTFARERGAELPHRLVSSAKSWLCNPSIDRTAQVLPFRGAQRELDEAMAGGERVSPVNASARYLAHLRAAWDDANPDEPADEQEVLVTVPASLRSGRARADRGRGARGRVREDHAARGAAGRVLRVPRRARRCVAQGPQARRRRARVRRRRRHHRLLADRGRDDGGALALERIAVGDHILLGGDNMDLALAAIVAAATCGQARSMRCSSARSSTRAGARRSSCSATMPPKSRADRDPRPRQQADRRHDQGRGHARAGRGACSSTASSRSSAPTRSAERRRAGRSARDGPALRARSRDHAPPRRVPRPVRPACRPRCCSTAA